MTAPRPSRPPAVRAIALAAAGALCALAFSSRPARAAEARPSGAATSAEAAAPRRPRGPRAAPPLRARIELRVTFRPWESGGTFRLETSTGQSDQGPARDLGGFSAAGGGVRRVLEGAQGTLVLRLQGGPRPGQPPVFGRWTLAGGTGAYAGMTGGGTFTALSGGDRRGGSPYELQFLVGTVLHEK